ncbi:lantibiotic dehydratase [Aquimarina muelleri]|uniref:Thiopeptide-type bacteriocin biosynthesis domain-containing protein n=1 Tax=Aquimarina muelleri TaxID=279356 RepID=A0A918JXT1_9FLAO|nr:lantibiotic dehydratase [Aquimarina muelleri]MCX2763856.1 lantibiotic dehydratase [Aquimarina muelleri]GGX29279.1 hypothetical protein GCM10007384_33070 [Aquimarina muelleri]
MDFFNELISRVVSFSVESYGCNANDVYNFFEENKLFQLSILTSSRSLYEDAKKSKTEKIKVSLDNYFSRAHLNPVPFGTFTSIGVLKWSDKRILTKSETLLLKVDFDNLLISEKLAATMSRDWKKFVYYTNPSIHFLSKSKISFYKFEKKTIGDIETKYVEIDYDENIKWLVERFENGAQIVEVVRDLEKDGFEKTEIHAFLLDSIEAGLVINEMIFYPYRNLSEVEGVYSKLVNNNLHSIKTTKDFDNFSQSYSKEQDALLLKQESSNKYSHSITAFEKDIGQLEVALQEKILKFINFTVTYNKKYTPINTSLLKFGNKFYHSYKDVFIPLSKVFNPYSGLQYSSTNLENDIRLHQDILSKMLVSNKDKVFLSKTVTNNAQVDMSNLPSTFSVVFELLTCKKTKKKITYFKYMGGTSAINLLSRFDQVSDRICVDIADYEKEIFKEQLIAEVNIISKPRATNVVASRQYYDYNIPLNTIYNKDSNPIFLSDIFIRFNGIRFILVSEKYKKEIIPRITSSVNTTLSESNVYKFLADLQSQQREIHSVNFNFNYYENMFLPFVPRIYLEDDILLYPAQILLSDDNFDFQGFKEYLLSRLEEYSFSKQISFIEDKGDITINTENEDHLHILFKKIKKVSPIYVCECLYESFIPEVHNKLNHYPHEIIASIKNTSFKADRSDFKIVKEDVTVGHKAPILSDWLYFDLYCNPYAENDLVNVIYHTIVVENSISQFFFVRYDHPDTHLRIRFKTESTPVIEDIFSKINNLKQENIIRNYHVLPYEQEMYRFGGEKLMGVTEHIFSLDSKHTVLTVLNNELKQNDIYMFSILKIEYYLRFFDFTIEEMISFCEKNIEAFSSRFNLDSKLRKSLNKIYTEIRRDIDDLKPNDFLEGIEIETEIKNTLRNSELIKDNYVMDLIHMSLNRVFNEKQRLNEFKSYYLAKSYFNQVKFTQKAIKKQTLFRG